MSASHDFEVAVKDLLGLLIEAQPGWTLVENEVQPPGAQFGKDIVTTFRTDAGRELHWHTECKSHQPGASLRKTELLPKLFDLWQSDEPIDVWCLVLAHIDLAASLRAMLASLRKRLQLPFSIVVLSPGAHGLRELFACDEELYGRVYDPASFEAPDAARRQARLDGFASWALEVSSADRRPRDDAWQLVHPRGIEALGDSAEHARSFLRGFDAGGWEPVVHGWAIERRTTTDEIVRGVRDGPPGFSHAWLIGAAGEGKSTALRQVAWALAQDPDEIVLWASAGVAKVELPREWIALLRPGARITLCVDTSTRLAGAAALRGDAWRLAEQGKRVSLLLCDRGIRRRRGRAWSDLADHTPRAALRRIEPLGEHEIDELVEQLVAYGLVDAKRAQQAARRIAHASGRADRRERSWLLPTLMEVTDRAGRRFEQILEGVLTELERDGHFDAARLLLDAAVAQAAGIRLPRAAAERLAERRDRSLAELEHDLDTELEEQALGSRRGARGGTVATHHRVVAEAFVEIGATSREQQQLFSEACRDLVEIASDRLDAFCDLHDDDFTLVNRAATYLAGVDVTRPYAAEMFEAWIALDPERRNFLAMHRLGVVLRDWLNREQSRRPPDAELIVELGRDARAAFVATLETAARLRRRPETCPPRMAPDLADVDALTLTSWSMLENLLGRTGDPVARIQSVYLAVLALGSPQPRARRLTCAPLAFALAELGHPELAAVPTAMLAGFAPRDVALLDLRRRLRRQGVAIPHDGLALVDGLVAELATDLLLDAELRWPETVYLQRALLERALRDIAAWLPEAPQIALARRRVAEQLGAT